MDLTLYKKIIIIGSPGSGKSYFASRLGKALALPVIHLDNEYWQPGWVETPRDEWRAKQEKLIAGDEWIIDGNYGNTLEMRFEAAQAVIFLDVSRLVCLKNILRRHGQPRSDLPEFLEETFDKDFLVFLGQVWNYPKTGKPKVLRLHLKHPETAFLTLRSRSEVSRVIKEIPFGAGSGRNEFK